MQFTHVFHLHSQLKFSIKQGEAISERLFQFQISLAQYAESDRFFILRSIPGGKFQKPSAPVQGIGLIGR